MKKIILAVTLLALAETQMQTAEARGFPVAAAVIGGVAVGAVVADTVVRQPVYYAPAPIYYQPAPVYYQPAPVAVSYAPTVVYTQPGYACAPVVTYGFGFGRPVYGGYYHGVRGYYGHDHFHR